MAEIWKPHPALVYKEWVNQIILELDLNDWESEFVQSIYKLLHKGFTLSKAQADKLESIYERTS